MADPLLSSLCTICHVNQPKYTCPRCSVQTCSIPCVRRHKLWSSCSGTRDPTVYKSKSELLTPAGVDHDYNFLLSIEHRIERSEKEVIENKGLVRWDELKDARAGNKGSGRPGQRALQKKQNPGDECIAAMLRMMGTKIHRAPKGMRRSVENGTSWSKTTRQINWQIEWMRNGGTTRQLGKMLNNKSIAYYYDEWMEEDRRARMTEDQRREVKKRKAVELKEKASKKAKASPSTTSDSFAASCLQDEHSGAWNVTLPTQSHSDTTKAFSADAYKRVNNHQLYLLRPLTSSKYPKVVVPIDVTQPLSEILRKRELVEFPTIFVFEEPIQSLPDGFMLEKDFLIASGQASHDHSASESSESASEEDDEMTNNHSALEEGEIDE